MNMKQNFKKLYSAHFKQAKIFVLAGLMGGMTACKDVLEPEAPTTAQNQQVNMLFNNSFDTNQSADLFMQHLSDINGAKFYVEGSEAFRFIADGSGCVNSFYSYSEPYCNDQEEWINYRCLSGNTIEIGDRVPGYYSDSIAYFGLPLKYKFVVNGCFSDPNEDWAIYEIDQDSYNNTFANMSDSALAMMAKNHLESLNADSGHICHIHDAILQGKGRWEVDNEEPVAVMSKGSKIGLNHSDVGIVQGTVPIQGEPEKREHFPYFGGVENKRLGAPSEPTRFRGRAYAVINNNYFYKVDDYGHWGNGTSAMRVVSTDSAAATFAHGLDADTLTMPFNDWYTVQIITKNGVQQIEYSIDNYQYGNLPITMWGLNNQGQNSIGMSIMQTPIEYDYYHAQTGTNNSSFDLYLSRPDYYGASSDFATGLNNVYCAPARKAKASNDGTVSEVVMHGGIEERRVVSDSYHTGLGTEFVFGGVKQSQR